MGPYNEIRDFFEKKNLKILEFAHPIEYILNILNLDEKSCKVLIDEISEDFKHIYSPEIIKNLNSIEKEQNSLPLPSIEEEEVIQTIKEKLLDENKVVTKGFIYITAFLLYKQWLKFYRDKSLCMVKVISCIA